MPFNHMQYGYRGNPMGGRGGGQGGGLRGGQVTRNRGMGPQSGPLARGGPRAGDFLGGGYPMESGDDDGRYYTRGYSERMQQGGGLGGGYPPYGGGGLGGGGALPPYGGGGQGGQGGGPYGGDGWKPRPYGGGGPLGGPFGGGGQGGGRPPKTFEDYFTPPPSQLFPGGLPQRGSDNYPDFGIKPHSQVGRQLAREGWTWNPGYAGGGGWRPPQDRRKETANY